MKQSLLFLYFFFLTLTIYSQGKLDLVAESLKKNESTRSDSRSSSNSSGGYYDSGDYILEEFGFLLVEFGMYLTYYAFFETDIETNHAASSAAMTKYPYLNSKKGNYSYSEGEETTIFKTKISNRYIVENSKISGIRLNADLQFLARFGVEAEYLQLWEENTNFDNNSLALFTTMAKYHRVRTEKFDAWWGLGATYVDGDVNEWGFTYGAGAELFFAKPFSLETNFYQAFINERTVDKFAALLHYHFDRYKFSGGYEYLKIGRPNFSMFSVGLGVSF